MDFTEHVKKEGPEVSLQDAIKQMERYCFKTEKVGGKQVRVPKKSDIKIYLETLLEQMDSDDWQKLAAAYKPLLNPARRNGGKIGRPRGEFYGLSGGAREKLLQEKAKSLGIWHMKYPDGCTECGTTSYKHCSGGICTRCYALLRELGVSLKEYRHLKATTGIGVSQQ